tara:strand:- start:5646 stop:5777 length:132 start_codon:yes stop_codon:yes gene_type:complete
MLVIKNAPKIAQGHTGRFSGYGEFASCSPEHFIAHAIRFTVGN